MQISTHATDGMMKQAQRVCWQRRSLAVNQVLLIARSADAGLIIMDCRAYAACNYHRGRVCCCLTIRACRCASGMAVRSMMVTCCQ